MLVRRAQKPVQGRVELFAPYSIREKLKLADGDALLVELDNSDEVLDDMRKTLGEERRFIPIKGTNMQQNIIDTAVAHGQFKTLAAELAAVSLIETLQGAGPFTVFAQTDAAFAKLPVSIVEDPLSPGRTDELTAILTYHVVPGEVMASQIVKLTEARTVNGQMLRISQDHGNVRVNDARPAWSRETLRGAR